MAQSYRFRVTGRVQGVRFRQSAAEQARSWGLAGWIRNLEDGSVEGVVSGAEDALKLFQTWLGHGPVMARVVALEWSAIPAETHAGYQVRG